MKKKFIAVSLVLFILICGFVSLFFRHTVSATVIAVDQKAESNSAWAYIDFSDGKYNISIYENCNTEKPVLTNVYSYDLPESVTVESGRENYYINILSDEFLIINFKSQGMHSDYIKNHIKDVLVCLDDKTQTAKTLYESEKENKIIYGNCDYCIVYNSKNNVLQKTELKTGNVSKEISLQKNYSIDFEVFPEKQYFTVKRDWFFPLSRIVKPEMLTLDLDIVENTKT